VPKVSEEHKELRREQILDGARRCFAQHGYEGATVARLEQEIGLSRGAIFNYFPNKAALFVELAVEMSQRVTDIWLNDGFRAVLDAVVHEDPDWLAVQFEATRRVRTDPDFRELVHERERQFEANRPQRLERLRGQVRDDVPVETAAIFLASVVNGLALRRATEEPMPDLDVIAKMVEEGVAPR
jgi:AcrR family transcriptional regulator